MNPMLTCKNRGHGSPVIGVPRHTAATVEEIAKISLEYECLACEARRLEEGAARQGELEEP